MAIAFASTDTLHAERDIRRMVRTLPCAQLQPCPSNRYMHNANLKADIDRFVKEVEGEV